jgi:hypothetical protein
MQVTKMKPTAVQIQIFKLCECWGSKTGSAVFRKGLQDPEKLIPKILDY